MKNLFNKIIAKFIVHRSRQSTDFFQKENRSGSNERVAILFSTRKNIICLGESERNAIFSNQEKNATYIAVPCT